MTSERRLYDLLTTAEIVTILRIDPHWTLPAGSKRAVARMTEAVNLLAADCVTRYWRSHDEMMAVAAEAEHLRAVRRQRRKVAA